jgi:hypothetical protein
MTGARKDGDAALEVDGAAAVDVALLDQPGKRIHRPFVALDPDRVRVRREEDRLLAAVAAQPREQVAFPVSGVGTISMSNPSGLSFAASRSGELPLVPGRVAVVDADQFAEELAVVAAPLVGSVVCPATPAGRRPALPSQK